MERHALRGSRSTEPPGSHGVDAADGPSEKPLDKAVMCLPLLSSPSSEEPHGKAEYNKVKRAEMDKVIKEHDMK
jgi:hypothetical protein